MMEISVGITAAWTDDPTIPQSYGSYSSYGSYRSFS